MTVSELIKKLKGFPGDMEVMVMDSDDRVAFITELGAGSYGSDMDEEDKHEEIEYEDGTFYRDDFNGDTVVIVTD